MKSCDPNPNTLTHSSTALDQISYESVRRHDTIELDRFSPNQ